MAGFQGISSESLLSYLLENPQLLNKILQNKMFEKNRFLKDLNLEFKTFKANGSDSLLGLGLAYSYQRDIATTTVEACPCNPREILPLTRRPILQIFWTAIFLSIYTDPGAER